MAENENATPLDGGGAPAPEASSPIAFSKRTTPDEADEAIARGPLDRLPLYKKHPGTIRVSGGTPVFKCGMAAFYQFRKGTQPIEFLFLGANAGQQAYKAANTTIRAIRMYTGKSYTVLPIWTRLEAYDQESGRTKIKETIVFRLVEAKEDILTHLENS